MSRIWKETISPTCMHEKLGVYKGIWMPQMDRCWDSNDGYQVTSRLIRTPWGTVEHATIKKIGKFTNDGSSDIPWGVKMEIKNELFGENRCAIEVYPKQKNLVDVADVYHLWIFSKDFDMPFGLHPNRDPQCSWIKRGVPKNLNPLIKNTQEMLEMHNIVERGD